MSKRNIDGKSLTPATPDNLAQLVGCKVILLVSGEVQVRTIEIDTRITEGPFVGKRFIARARTHGLVIDPDTTVIVG